MRNGNVILRMSNIVTACDRRAATLITCRLQKVFHFSCSCHKHNDCYSYIRISYRCNHNNGICTVTTVKKIQWNLSWWENNAPHNWSFGIAITLPKRRLSKRRSPLCHPSPALATTTDWAICDVQPVITGGSHNTHIFFITLSCCCKHAIDLA